MRTYLDGILLKLLIGPLLILIFINDSEKENYYELAEITNQPDFQEKKKYRKLPPNSGGLQHTLSLSEHVVTRTQQGPWAELCT